MTAQLFLVSNLSVSGGQDFAPGRFPFGRRNGSRRMEPNAVKWNAADGM